MIEAALRERGVNRPCPRCGTNLFRVMPGLALIALQQPGNDLEVGGPALPAAITLCANCGFVSEHALGALGLNNNPEFTNAGVNVYDSKR